MRHRPFDPAADGAVACVASVIRFALVAILVVGLIASAVMFQPPAPKAPHSVPTIEQLQPLADLVVASVAVSDVVTTRFAGHLGSLEAIVIARGEALVSVDLNSARFVDVDVVNRTATLILSRPHVLSARLDHQRTRIHSVSAGGLWAAVPTDAGRAQLIDHAMVAAESAIAAAAESDHVTDKARHHSESILCTFLTDTLGWHIRVRWAD